MRDGHLRSKQPFPPAVAAGLLVTRTSRGKFQLCHCGFALFFRDGLEASSADKDSQLDVLPDEVILARLDQEGKIVGRKLRLGSSSSVMEVGTLPATVGGVTLDAQVCRARRTLRAWPLPFG